MISGRPREMEPMLARGGVAGVLIRERDWAGTAVGVMEAWPQSLRTALSVCLLSKFPMFVFWGPDMVQFYNDMFVPVMGSKHPAAQPTAGLRGLHPAQLGQPRITGPGLLVAVLDQLHHCHADHLAQPRSGTYRITLATARSCRAQGRAPRCGGGQREARYGEQPKSWRIRASSRLIGAALASVTITCWGTQIGVLPQARATGVHRRSGADEPV